MTVSKLVFTPLSYTGWGSLQQLLPEVKKYDPAHILIVTDPVLKDIGLVDKVSAPLIQNGYEVDVYADTAPEPPLALGEKLVSYAKSRKFDLVIGVGGGSALDLAKLTAVLAVHDGAVEEYLNLTGRKQISKKGLPKILIPTTSGTGSEVTNISVLSLESTKDVVTHDYLLADAAIVDPELTLSVPPKVTAATGVDALTHAVEAYISVNANPATDALALKAIRMISSSLRAAVEDGKDKEARTQMSYGSYLAGLAFFNAGVAGVHALAYPLGGQFHISHGESNAVLLPYVMGYIRSSCVTKMRDIFEALGGNATSLSTEEASYQCVKHLQSLIKDVGIPQTLRRFDIPESALQKLTEDGVQQNEFSLAVLCLFMKKDIRAIYQSAYDGAIVEPMH
ncbi:iron-containing alcohol dehydrogenase [Bacillus megaterium]|nr:iron-containing alcohol dehydrogenase [Priestia megaterium]